MTTKKDIAELKANQEALKEDQVATGKDIASIIRALHNMSGALDATLKALHDHNIKVDLPDYAKPK